jgi:hypothetical protein
MIDDATHVVEGLACLVLLRQLALERPQLGPQRPPHHHQQRTQHALPGMGMGMSRLVKHEIGMSNDPLGRSSRLPPTELSVTISSRVSDQGRPRYHRCTRDRSKAHSFPHL